MIRAYWYSPPKAEAMRGGISQAKPSEILPQIIKNAVIVPRCSGKFTSRLTAVIAGAPAAMKKLARIIKGTNGNNRKGRVKAEVRNTGARAAERIITATRPERFQR